MEFQIHMTEMVCVTEQYMTDHLLVIGSQTEQANVLTLITHLVKLPKSCCTEKVCSFALNRHIHNLHQNHLMMPDNKRKTTHELIIVTKCLHMYIYYTLYLIFGATITTL